MFSNNWQTRVNKFCDVCRKVSGCGRSMLSLSTILPRSPRTKLILRCCCSGPFIWMRVTTCSTARDSQKLFPFLVAGHVTSLFNLADLYRQQNHCAKSKFYFSQCLAYSECLSEANILITACQSAEPHPDRDVTKQYSQQQPLSGDFLDQNSIDLERRVNLSKCHSKRS